MDRIKLLLTTHFPFSTCIPIRITDVNYGNHVGNDVFLGLLHEARVQFLKSFHYSELDFGGVGLIMSDAALEFKQELLYGHEVIVKVAATGFDKFGFDLHYQMETCTDEALVVAARAKTGMLCFDYAKKKLVPVPETAKLRLLQASAAC